MKNFNIFGVHRKIRVLGGVHKKPIYVGGLPKNGGGRGGGGLGQFADLRRGLARKSGVDIPIHTML